MNDEDFAFWGGFVLACIIFAVIIGIGGCDNYHYVRRVEKELELAKKYDVPVSMSIGKGKAVRKDVTKNKHEKS